MSAELTISIVINLIVLAFFAGIYVCTIKNHGKNLEDLKSYFSEKIEDIKINFKDHLDRVEQKQDKHNNVIERVYASERDISVIQEQIKVENHRIQDLEEIIR